MSDVMNQKRTTHGLLAAFKNHDDLLEAATRAHAEGYRKMDAYSPFPVEGLAAALGRKPFGISFLFLIGGVSGCVGGFLLQWFAMAIDYPLNIGGRPLNSWPMFIPITFELTILGAALAGFLGTLLLNGAFELYHPVFNIPEFRNRASRDGFFLCIEASDAKYDATRTAAFLRKLAPLWVREVES
jgi:hypothetical protein